MNERQKRDLKEVLLQTALVAAIGAALSVGVFFLYRPLMNALGKEYVFHRFLFGSIYGWALGVLNFFGMGISLILVTSSVKDRQEGQKKGQLFFTVRLVLLFALVVVGCLLPVFHPAAIMISLALTWLGVTVYALIFRAFSAKKKAADGQASEEADGKEPGDGAENEEGTSAADADGNNAADADKAAADEQPENEESADR